MEWRCLLVVSAVAVCGCERPAPSPPAATPAPTPVVMSAPTPDPDPLTPAGTYILLSPASNIGRDGIIRFTAGARLRQVRGNTFQDADGRTVQLRADQITNHLRIAEAMLGPQFSTGIAPLPPLAGASKSPRVDPFSNSRSLQIGSISTPKADGSHGAGATVSRVGHSSGGVGYYDRYGALHYKDSEGHWHVSR